MAFRQIGGSRVYKSWKEWAEDDYIIGTFEATYQDQFGNDGYQVKVTESSMEAFKPGSVAGLNSSGSLKFKMAEVEEGATIKVIYEGQGTIEKGKFKGKPFHDISVYTDDEGAAETDGSIESLDEEIL